MRPLILAVFLIAALSGSAPAAQPSWLGGLFGATTSHAHRPVHKPRASKPQPKADAPVDAAATAPADTAAPIPLPRPRPDLQVAEAPKPMPAEDAPKPAEAAPKATDTPAPASPSTTTAKPDDKATPTTPADAAPASTAAPVSTTATPAPGPAEGETTTPKPPRVYQTACPAVITGLVTAKPLPPISEGQCGTQSPLSVTAILVNGRSVPLTAPETFGCEMATDLPGWVADVDNYIWSTQNTRIKSVVTGGSYECRPRNTPDGSSDLSEHGRADALDFVGFTLDDGRQLTVTNDYNSADAKISKLMHFAHDAACTRFTTVLGPDANSLHHDHFHFDLGCHGKTCTYRLCE